MYGAVMIAIAKIGINLKNIKNLDMSTGLMYK